MRFLVTVEEVSTCEYVVEAEDEGEIERMDWGEIMSDENLYADYGSNYRIADIRKMKAAND